MIVVKVSETSKHFRNSYSAVQQKRIWFKKDEKIVTGEKAWKVEGYSKYGIEVVCIKKGVGEKFKVASNWRTG